ncbi:MAG: hypothetical protein H6917_08060 [Novosphingobium sp.]|nr:hypothetical protein [Novosphingobium sp.]MCP5402330.1 hypothetical protein [Novosphingobium sp.]
MDAGDIFAGLLVIGGIAAVAAAASSKNKERRERDDRYPEPDYREPSGRYGGYPDSRYEGRDQYGSSSSEIGEAVDRCIGEVERGERRVDGVDSVWRDGEGWRVDGRMDDGRDFSCSLDGDGRIRKLTVGGQAA